MSSKVRFCQYVIDSSSISQKLMVYSVIGHFDSLLNYPPIVTLTRSSFMKGVRSSQGRFKTGSHCALAFASVFFFASLK